LKRAANPAIALARRKETKAAQSAQRTHATRGDAEGRWQQILQVATELFRKKGFIATSIQDVSDAVGLLKGSLYYYIRSKEDLLFEILKGLHEDGEQIIAAVEFGSDNPIEQLRIYLREAAIFGASNSDRLAIFLRDFDYVPEERRREIITERQMYAETVERLFTEARAKGMLREGLDLRLISTLISGAISSTHQWLQPNGRLPLKLAADEISRVLVGGFLTSEPRRRGTRATAKPVTANPPGGEPKLHRSGKSRSHGDGARKAAGAPAKGGEATDAAKAKPVEKKPRSRLSAAKGAQVTGTRAHK
jgi:AcrR family transcriptional regulator